VLLDPEPELLGTAALLELADAATEVADRLDDPGVVVETEFVLLADVVAAAWLSVLVLVPSETRGSAVKRLVVLVNPGQLVLPITVIVTG